MQHFASRDLMVGSLPGQEAALWAIDGGCEGCSTCTNNTNTAKPSQRLADEFDLAALQQQLRAARD